MEFVADSGGSSVATGYPIEVPRYGYAARRDRLIEILRWVQDDSADGTLMEGQFQSLMILALTELQRSAVRPHIEGSGAKVALAKRAEKYILTHFREPLSISIVAGALRCNSDYLGRCIKAATGLTVTDVVQELRTAHARFLLCQLEATIDQIADACDYADSRYFRKVFRKHTGLSPSAYRRLNGGVRLNTQVAWHDRAGPGESGTQGLLASDPLRATGPGP